ncbi:MAG: hypothetical protein ACREPV_08510 [Lysobacter sp.]
MTTIDVDDEWLDKTRKAVQEADANRSLFRMPGVESQPFVDLFEWRVMRLEAGGSQYDVLVGYDIATGCGRASTPVQAFDATRAEATSRSGRLYRLVGAPSYNSDAEYVFRSWLGRFLTDSNHSDVSQEYWDAISSTIPSSPATTKGNDEPAR